MVMIIAMGINFHTQNNYDIVIIIIIIIYNTKVMTDISQEASR